jgi:hypothetical protein
MAVLQRESRFVRMDAQRRQMRIMCDRAAPFQMASLRSRENLSLCSLVPKVCGSATALEKMMRERGLSVDHTTIYCWVQCYAPELGRCCRSHLKITNGSWRVDETYVKVKGVWAYLYRAVDSHGNTLEFLLSPIRDTQAAKCSLEERFQCFSHRSSPRYHRRQERRLSESTQCTKTAETVPAS